MFGQGKCGQGMIMVERRREMVATGNQNVKGYSYSVYSVEIKASKG